MVCEDAHHDFTFDIPEEESAADVRQSQSSGGMLANGQYGLPNPQGVPTLAHTGTEGMSPEKRTRILFNQMATQKSVLLKILAICATPIPVESAYDQIEDARKSHSSVFDSETLCSLLEQAGALERVDESGELLTREDSCVHTVIENGVEYLAPAPCKQAYWQTTRVGRTYIAADNPTERLRILFEEDAHYIPIYKQIFALCLRAGGATTPDISTCVDGSPLLQNPRCYATKFIDRLERAGGIEWKSAWVATECGSQFLKELESDSTSK